MRRRLTIPAGGRLGWQPPAGGFESGGRGTRRRSGAGCGCALSSSSAACASSSDSETGSPASLSPMAPNQHLAHEPVRRSVTRGCAQRGAGCRHASRGRAAGRIGEALHCRGPRSIRSRSVTNFGPGSTELRHDCRSAPRPAGPGVATRCLTCQRKSCLPGHGHIPGRSPIYPDLVGPGSWNTRDATDRD